MFLIKSRMVRFKGDEVWPNSWGEIIFSCLKVYECYTTAIKKMRENIMGFAEAVKSAFSNYVNFKGRAARSEFWWFYLFFIIMVFGLSFLTGISAVFGIVLLAFYVVVILPYFAVLIRRMHDVDKSGWFCLIPFYNIYLAIIKGTDGPNRFGEDSVGGVGDTFD